jgi:beta-lactamase superfamily II metal-dependent hydrolase
MTKDVQIRMYNVGFGDCFLLKFPAADRPRKVLIDCGKHRHSRCQPSLDIVVRQVQKDIVDADGKKRIDVLVVTHRHQDHVVGFEQEGWDDVEVGEVWMPWTEDPDDPVARRICKSQSVRALQLQTGISALSLDGEQKSYLLGYAGNNLTNAAAMKLLHKGFLGSPLRRFLPKGDAAGPLNTDRLSGVEVHVLGPSRSEAVIRDMDPPVAESFLRAMLGAMGGEPAPDSPFSKKSILSRQEYCEWFQKNKQKDPLDDFSEEAAKHFRQWIENPETELAAALEKSVNGTSLVLLFKMGEAALLFPGDAQWGTWNEILQDETWTRLLGSVIFYKMGHHGSHNATPRTFVENFVSDKTIAMLPTDDVKQWPTIPKKELLDGFIQRKARLVRSDKPLDGGDPDCFQRQSIGSESDSLYVDLHLPC